MGFMVEKLETLAKSQGSSILIIEDDEGIRTSLRLALEFEGYTVFTAANGKEGLDVLPTMPRPCLILLDLMMPVMNGWEFIKALEEGDVTLATIPVVIVTAFAEQAQALKSKGVIKKPVDLDVLFQAVKKWCPSPP